MAVNEDRLKLRHRALLDCVCMNELCVFEIGSKMAPCAAVNIKSAFRLVTYVSLHPYLLCYLCKL